MSYWVAGAAVVGTIGGAMIGADAAGDAADSQAASSAASVAEQRRQYDLTRSDFAPYRDAGGRALKQLEDANTLDGSDLVREVEGDKGYQFGLRQGEQALGRRIAAGGGRVSGAALKAATRFGTDYASTGYGAAYQRRQDRLNRLAALAGIGQTATSGSAAAGANSANAISSLLSSQGDAAAAGQLARGSIWGNTTNQLAAIAGRAYRPAADNPFPQWGSGGGFGSGSGGMGD